MNRILLFIACLLTVATTASAQQDSTKVKTKKERKVELYGSVYDSFTKAQVKAHLTLMTARDSAVVDTMTCWTWGTNTFYEFKVPARQEDYIIKGTCEGYEDGYLNYNLRHISRNNHFELPRLLMKKKQEENLAGEGALGEVVVRGTRVKIAYRGDTIVYNAAAFNLPEGSMLDGLIRQMPGAELKDNGDIYINGKKVDYLMLNGKDFFKGQNKVMLDNLPYFTVKDIKVYDKSTRQSEMIGHDVEKKDYVMDVNLKREYNRGYLANMEAGLGTDDRYMARLFALYYDDHSRVSLFGNVNNVNENRKPGGEGEWKPSNMPVGLRTTRQAGMDLTTEDGDKHYEDQFNTLLEWSDNDFETRTSRETFAAGGNILGGSTSFSRQKDFRFSATNYLEWKDPVNLMFNVGANYNNGHRNSASQDSTYRDYIINRVQNTGYNRYRSLALNGSLTWFKKFEWGDYISLGLSAAYNRQKPNDSFTRQDTYYAQTGTNDLRDNYADTHNSNYNYEATAGYTLQMPGNWYISTAAKYKQTRDDNYNSSYRLDWLGTMTPHDLGWLPSTREAMQQALDADNSNDSHRLTRSYSGGLSLSHSSDDFFFNANMEVEHRRERMHYTAARLDTLAHRSHTILHPTLFIGQWGKNNRWFNYDMSVTLPNFASLMPRDNTTNPLALSINNPHLKSRIDHRIHANLSWTVDSLKRTITLWANATLTQRAWGTRTTYNTATGAYTYQNDNINGNWSASGGASFQKPIDRAKHLTYSQRININYNHSVDFDILNAQSSMVNAQSSMVNGQSSMVNGQSTVNNWTFDTHLTLEYQLDKLTVSLNGGLDYRLANSRRENFQRINAFDYEYGTTLRYTIPWITVDLATDLKMFSRRGYYSDLMNDDHLVWNAELSRSFLKGKLTAKLQAFDLLHQLSNTQYTVNAQGRTETWQNCIPRYLMCTLAYKFTRQPKKNKDN